MPYNLIDGHQRFGGTFQIIYKITRCHYPVDHNPTRVYSGVFMRVVLTRYTKLSAITNTCFQLIILNRNHRKPPITTTACGLELFTAMKIMGSVAV